MKPGLTGQGLGADFIDAGLEFAQEQYDPTVIELEVALFTERAISVYEDVGFERVDTISKETNGGEFKFLKMKKIIR